MLVVPRSAVIYLRDFQEGEVRELTTICDNLLQIKQGGDN